MVGSSTTIGSVTMKTKCFSIVIIHKKIIFDIFVWSKSRSLFIAVPLHPLLLLVFIVFLIPILSRLKVILPSVFVLRKAKVNKNALLGLAVVSRL